MKKWILAATLAVAGLAATDARAQDGHAPGSPEGGVVGAHFSAKPYWSSGLFGNSFFSSRNNIARMPTLPVYMAAPWYLYWPYDGHFQTIAPMAHGLYYPPPTYTGNPYLPGGYPGYLPGNPAPAFPVNPAKP